MPTFTMLRSDADDFTSRSHGGKPIPRGDAACALVRTTDMRPCDGTA